MGCTIIFCTSWPWPRYAMVEADKDQTNPHTTSESYFRDHFFTIFCFVFTIFKLFSSWFSVHLVVQKLWLFSRVLTKLVLTAFACFQCLCGEMDIWNWMSTIWLMLPSPFILVWTLDIIIGSVSSPWCKLVMFFIKAGLQSLHSKVRASTI